MRVRVPYFCFLLLLIWTSMQAKESSNLLHDYIKLALESNTEILSAQLAAEASQQDSRLNSALPDPAFMVEGRGIPLQASLFSETREWMFMLEQMFPPPGTLKRLQEKGQFSADIETEMLQAVRNDIRQQVKKLYYDISYLDAALATNREHVLLLDEFEQIAQRKYVVGKSGQQDLYQIKIEQARLKTEELSLQEKRSSKAAELNRLLKRDLYETIPAAQLDSTITQLSNVIFDSLLIKSNPFLKAARIRIAAGENDIDLARANKRPSLKVMGGYMAMNDRDDALMGRVGLTLPFMPWSSKDTRAALEKSRVLRNKYETDYITLKDQLAVRIAETTNSISALADQINLYNTKIVPASEHTVTLSIAAYQTDSLDFLSLVQYAREQLKNELRRDELISSYQQKLAQLEYILGTSLDEVIK